MEWFLFIFCAIQPIYITLLTSIPVFFFIGRSFFVVLTRRRSGRYDAKHTYFIVSDRKLLADIIQYCLSIPWIDPIPPSLSAFFRNFLTYFSCAPNLFSFYQKFVLLDFIRYYFSIFTLRFKPLGHSRIVRNN